MPISKIDYIKRQAKLELARRELYSYCQIMQPAFYTDDKEYLKDMTTRMQHFVEHSKKHFLVVNAPPRHAKSFTATNMIEWLLGVQRARNLKIMSGSYNEKVSGTFAKKIRDSIDTKKMGAKIVYSDIFPNTKIKYGEASASQWALEGSTETNYLATSPTGTATGFGANIIVIDDLIKNDYEAYNETSLEAHWSWFTNTIMQRTEGDDWKIIIIMTRWAERDLAGRVIEEYGDDVELIKYKAVQDDGTMLCPTILNRKSYELKIKEMNADIVEANYQQEPIDVKNRLYSDFKEWETLPEHTKVYNQTDTADEGTDFLCSINYVEYDKEVYITDLVFTDRPMEFTEVEVAELLYNGDVNESIIESNNGGRGFARNVGRIIKEKYNSNKVVIKPVPQTKNKVSRILTSAGWVNNHVYMPLNWRTRYPEFYKHIKNYQGKGKNLHDDGADVLASIYEKMTGKIKPKVYSKKQLGIGR